MRGARGRDSGGTLPRGVGVSRPGREDVSGRRKLKAEGTISAKVLRWECARCIQEEVSRSAWWERGGWDRGGGWAGRGGQGPPARCLDFVLSYRKPPGGFMRRSDFPLAACGKQTKGTERKWGTREEAPAGHGFRRRAGRKMVGDVSVASWEGGEGLNGRKDLSAWTWA